MRAREAPVQGPERQSVAGDPSAGDPGPQARGCVLRKAPALEMDLVLAGTETQQRFWRTGPTQERGLVLANMAPRMEGLGDSKVLHACSCGGSGTDWATQPLAPQ